MYTSKIYLTKKYVTKEEWLEFINTINSYTSIFSLWKVFIIFDKSTIHYYVQTNINLPTSINGLESFILKKCTDIKIDKKAVFPYFSTIGCNAVDLYNKFSFHHSILNCIIINFS